MSRRIMIASGVAHLALLAGSAFAIAPMSEDHAPAVSAVDAPVVSYALHAPAERDLANPNTERSSTRPDPSRVGWQGEDEPMMGDPAAPPEVSRFGVQGPSDNPDPHIARHDDPRSAFVSFDLIGPWDKDLRYGEGAAPTAPWARDDALGVDATSARGRRVGVDIAPATGQRALGTSGIGRCTCPLPEGAQVRGSVTAGAASVQGDLNPAAVQSVVRANLGRFRICYEGALRTCPNLQGRVTVRFVIGTDGHVVRASPVGSDLVDRSVASCVARAFLSLEFPPPSRGPVTVVYPLSFAPG